MNNKFGVFCQKKSVLPRNSELISICVFDEVGYVICLQQMKHKKNRIIVYCSSDNISDMNLDDNEEHNAEKQDILLRNVLYNEEHNEGHNEEKQDIFLSNVPMTTRIVSFYVILNGKIKREIRFFINYLCVVVGLQIISFNQDITKWYIYNTCLNIYSKYKIVFIQITDCYFILQIIVKDIKNILVSPILFIVDTLTLSRVRNLVSQNFLSFIRWISFLLRIFLLQMDEDGEEILNKIKETNIFRKQKPGTTSFLKKNHHYNEDFTFISFRYLRRKTYLFFRLLALSSLFFIFFKNNQRLKIESNLPNLVYIIDNFNFHNKEIVYENSWKRTLNQNFLIQDSNQIPNDLRLFESSQIVKSRFSDRARIVNLLNAGKFKKNLKLNMDNDQFANHLKSDQLDSYFFDQKNMNLVNEIFKNYDIVYKEDFKFRKLREYDYNTLEYIYIKYIPSIISTTFVRYKHLVLDKMDILKNKLKDQYLNIEEQSLIKKIVNVKEFVYLQQANDLIHILEKFVKNNLILNKVKIIFNEKTIKIYKIENHSIFSNNYIKELLIKNPILNKTIFLDDDSYTHRLCLFIEHYLNNLLHISRNIISYWFNICLDFAEIYFVRVNHQYNYITSLVDVSEEIFLSDKYPYNFKTYNVFSNQKGLIGLCDKNEFQDLSKLKSFPYFNKKKLVNEFEVYSRENSSFITELNVLDTLHFGSETYSNSNVINEVDQTLLKIIPLFYVEFIDKIGTFNQFTHDKITILNKKEFENLKQKIGQFVSDEKFQLDLLWNKVRKKMSCNYNINTFHLINETNKNDMLISHLPLVCHSIKSMSIKNTNLLNNNSNLLSNCKNEYFIDQFYPLNSFDLWESLTKIFIKRFKRNTLDVNNTDIPINNKKFVVDYYKLSSVSRDIDYIHNQIQVIKQYIHWFFTLEWWSLLQISGEKIWSIILQDILDYIYSFRIYMQNYFNDKSDMLKNKSDYLFDKEDNQFYQIFHSINFIVFKQLETQKQHTVLSIWKNIHFSSFRINLLSYYVSILSFFSHYWFSLLIGGSSFFLWILFERVRTLTHLSWNTELDLLILSKLRGTRSMRVVMTSKSIKKKNPLKEQYDLSLEYPSVWLRYFFSHQIGHRIQTMQIYNSNTVDIYGDTRDLAFEVAVGNQSLLGLTLSTLDEKIPYHNGYDTFNQEGLDYLKQLTNDHYKWYQNFDERLLHNQRFISFAFYKMHSSSLELWYQDKSKLIKQDYLPIPLQLSGLYSKAILLVGPQDTGKSYVAKSLAADANLPFIYLAIDKLIDVLEFEDETLEGNSSLYFLRENFLKYKIISKFIKNMDSCLVWMPSLEYFYKHNFAISKTKDFCILMILRFLISDITTFLKEKPNIKIIGSCEDTSYLDPEFVSPERFNRFMNVRLPSNVRRPQIFANFLKNHLSINYEDSWFSEFSNSTMGFTLRDIRGLSNEALLISVQKQKFKLNLEDIRLVLYRGLRAHRDLSQAASIVKNNEKLQYKIGRAVVQTTLLRPNPMIPLRSKYELWKPRFYFLSKVYLQPDSKESAVTQLHILPHILNCLAGLAAQDAWLLLQKNRLREETFDVNSKINHDLDLAIYLFQSIFKDFPSLDISTFHDKNLFHPEFHAMDYVVPIDQGNELIDKVYNIYADEGNILKFDEKCPSEIFFKDTLLDVSSSYREERFSLSRNILFEIFKRVDESLSLFSSLRFFGRLPYIGKSFEIQKSHASIYHISWEMMRTQIPKDLDYVFYGMIFNQRIKTFKLAKPHENIIEYEPAINDILSFQGRAIWNPAATFFRNLIFRQRNLFVNEEFLSILYLMYQSQKEIQLMPQKKRQSDLWTPDAYLERLAMEKLEENSEKKKKVKKISQTFHMFKHLAHANAIFERPEGDVPNNSEMPFLKSFLAPNRFSKFSFIEDIFYQNNVLKDDNLKLQELLTYASILESYNFLLKFFIKNHFLIENITDILLEKGILFEKDLQAIILESFKDSK
jgi:hypothetical protein